MCLGGARSTFGTERVFVLSVCFFCFLYFQKKRIVGLEEQKATSYLKNWNLEPFPKDFGGDIDTGFSPTSKCLKRRKESSNGMSIFLVRPGQLVKFSCYKAV